MKLFLLTRLANFDEHSAGLIRATSEQEARRIADEELKDPNRSWNDSDVTCQVVTEEGDAGVVMYSYNAS